MSSGRSEPAAVHGLRKQLQRQKKGPCSLGKRKARIYIPEERSGERHWCALERKLHWVLHLEGFYPLSNGADLRRGPRGGPQ